MMRKPRPGVNGDPVPFSAGNPIGRWVYVAGRGRYIAIRASRIRHLTRSGREAIEDGLRVQR